MMTKKIQGKNIALIPINQSHVDSLFTIWSSPLVTRYMNIEPMRSRNEASEMARLFSQLAKNNRAVRYAIEFSGEIIGSCGFNEYIIKNKRVEIGYELDVPFWGQGLGYKIVSLLCEYAFDQLNCVRIDAKVHPENIASIKLLSKLEFILEGRLSSYECNPDGSFEDILLFAKINEREL